MVQSLPPCFRSMVEQYLIHHVKHPPPLSLAEWPDAVGGSITLEGSGTAGCERGAELSRAGAASSTAAASRLFNLRQGGSELDFGGSARSTILVAAAEQRVFDGLRLRTDRRCGALASR